MALAACTSSEPTVTAILPPATTSSASAAPTTTVPPDTVPDPGNAVLRIGPGSDLAKAVDDAPPGQAFVIAAGIHRGHRVEPKDGMSFVGETGAVISGAQILSGFAPDGDVWVLEGVIPDARNHGQCVDGYEGCTMTQDLFMDDVVLWQVTEREDLASGTWLWEDDVVYVADDPTLRRVELSITPYAFVGSADDVVLRGLTVEKYATPAQDGAIQSQMPGEGEFGDNWLIESVDVWGNHGAGIRTGNHATIRDSRIHHNGQLGITCAGVEDVVVEDNEIDHNNVAGFLWQWEAGGVKVTRSSDLVFRGNDVHDNRGPGLWADIDATDVLYEGNTITDNTGPGIFYEISRRGVVRDNTIERNGSDDLTWLWGAGILVAGSFDVEIYNNQVLDNGNGIAGLQQDRGDGPFGPYLLADLSVYDNTVRLGDGRMGVVEDMGDEGVFEGRDNRFESNIYLDQSGRSYAWRDRLLDRDGWVDAGQDVDGTWR